MARPSPKPPSPDGALPRSKRSKIRSRSSPRTPGPWSETVMWRVVAVVLGAHDDRSCAWARGAARCRRGCARRGRPRRGRRAPSTGPAAAGRRGRCPRPSRAARTRRHRAAQLAELDGLGAQRDVGVEAAEVQQLGRQAGQAPQLRWAPATWSSASAGSSARPGGPRAAARACPRGRSAVCAARVMRSRRRRGGPAPGGAAPLHRRQRAGEVAHLVVAVVARRRCVGALLGDPQRRGAQPRERRLSWSPGRGRGRTRRRGRSRRRPGTRCGPGRPRRPRR